MIRQINSPRYKFTDITFNENSAALAVEQYILLLQNWSLK